MKTRIITVVAAAGLFAGIAQAQPVDQRHAYQQGRVAQGIRSGELTPGETHRIEHQQRSIDRQESRMRYRHGGRLTRYDRARLQHRENHASRHIWRAKHNDRVG